MIPEEIIIRKIRYVRGVKVILDSDLADMYGVETKRLKEQVKRNISRFPSHFMFELTKEEYLVLRSQIATLKQGAHAKWILDFEFTTHKLIEIKIVHHASFIMYLLSFIMRLSSS